MKYLNIYNIKSSISIFTSYRNIPIQISGGKELTHLLHTPNLLLPGSTGKRGGRDACAVGQKNELQ